MTRPLALRLWLGGSAGLPALAEYALARRVHNGQRSEPARLRERIGRATRPRPDGRLVWINAASVGEVASIADLASDLAAEGLRVLITTTTTTGGARTAAISSALHQYQPLDTARAARRFLDHWKPDLACMVEGDLWPRLLTETARREIPLALLNARPSRSRTRAPRLMAALMAPFDLVTTQGPAVTAELADLGLPPDRLLTAGDLKAAAAPLAADPARLAELATSFAARPLWAAVSTHDGDDSQVIAAHLAARDRHPGLRLILAPRHPARGDAVARLLDAAGLVTARASRGDAILPETEVWLVDRLGDTGLIYRLAPLVFLGGSFGAQGGHNPWEAARLGAAVLHGPRLRNAAAAYAELDAAGAGRMVADGAALGTAVADLIGQPALQAARDAALRLMADRGQARSRTRIALLALLRRG